MDLNLNIYRQLRFQNENEKSLGSADVQRKCLVQMLKASSVSLENSATCDLLTTKLNNYSDTIIQDGGNIYNGQLKSLLEKSKTALGSERFRSRLSEINCAKFLNPLTCSANTNHCIKSEAFSFDEFNDVQEAILNRCLPKTDHKSNFKNQKAEINYPEAPRDSTNRRFNDSTAKNNLCFKTARDELQLQNVKKYGKSSAQQNNSGISGQKRKLGTRRNINSKFISPLLTNNGSTEEEKSEESISDMDERFKNIEPKMIELIKSEIMDCGPNIHWSDIAGLEFAKNAIQEAVVWPMLRPDIFTGLRRPPKGILLFGPPGTGKTLIGKCVASQSKSTFFSISASSLTSKWVGDGEKMVRALFTVARVHQPAVIFIDEIDSLLSQRNETEHESSRRIKTEFLVQLDGATTDEEERILIIGATNRPQELDEAARRRFVKRLYIPLPEFEARLQLVQKLISGERHELNEEHFKEIARLSEGYSGADIRNLCSEASLGPIRSIDIAVMEYISPTQVRPLQREDFEKAFCRVKTSVSQQDLEHYTIWNGTYGSGSVF